MKAKRLKDVVRLMVLACSSGRTQHNFVPAEHDFNVQRTNSNSVVVQPGRNHAFVKAVKYMVICKILQRLLEMIRSWRSRSSSCLHRASDILFSSLGNLDIDMELGHRARISLDSSSLRMVSLTLDLYRAVQRRGRDPAERIKSGSSLHSLLECCLLGWLLLLPWHYNARRMNDCMWASLALPFAHSVSLAQNFSL